MTLHCRVSKATIPPPMIGTKSHFSFCFDRKSFLNALNKKTQGQAFRLTEHQHDLFFSLNLHHNTPLWRSLAVKQLLDSPFNQKFFEEHFDSQVMSFGWKNLTIEAIAPRLHSLKVTEVATSSLFLEGITEEGGTFL